MYNMFNVNSGDGHDGGGDGDVCRMVMQLVLLVLILLMVQEFAPLLPLRLLLLSQSSRLPVFAVLMALRHGPKHQSFGDRSCSPKPML